MNEEKKKILEMLSDGKITVEEATKLLELIEAEEPGEEALKAEPVSLKKPKYLRVIVEPPEGSVSAREFDRVNIRVPMSLIRAGVKFSSLIPHDAANRVDDALKDKGINFSLRNIKDEDIEQLVSALSDFEVNVEGKEMIKIYAE